MSTHRERFGSAHLHLYALTLPFLAVALWLSWNGAVALADHMWIDTVMRHAPSKDQDPRVVLVYLTDETRTRLDLPPTIPRGLYASFLEKVAALGARGTLVDLFLLKNRDDPMGDQRLRDTAEKLKNVAFICLYPDDDGTSRTPLLTPLEGQLDGRYLAHNLLDSDSLGTLLDVPLERTFSDIDGGKHGYSPTAASPGTPIVLPNLARVGAAFCDPSAPMRLEPDGPRPWYLASGGVLAFGGRRIATYGANHRVYLNLSRPRTRVGPPRSRDATEGLYETWMFEELMPHKFETGAQPFAGRTVILGSREEYVHDLHDTALGTLYGPGINAQIISGLLDNRLLNLIGQQVVIPLCILLWALGVWVFATVSPLAAAMGAASGVAALLGASIVLYLQAALWLPVVVPVATCISTYVVVAIARARATEHERRFVRDIFSRYAPHQLVEMLVSDPSRLQLGGQVQEVSVLFADINGFTPLTEAMGPEQTIEMLNEYFGRMTEVVFRHGGLIKQFVGDEIMVIFGAPVYRDDHAAAAIATAWDMCDEVARLRAERESQGKRGFDVKFGLNSGQVVLGNIGSAQRVEYGAVGDAVNAASRIMGLSAEAQSTTRILVGERTVQLGGEGWDVRETGTFTVRGKSESLRVFELRGPR